MLVIWKLRARPRRLISNGLRPVISAPSRRIVPLLGGKRPLIRLNSVDLPAPLGPINACRSPCAIESVTPRMISVLPKLLQTPVNSSAARAATSPPPLGVGGAGVAALLSALMDHSEQPRLTSLRILTCPLLDLDLDRIPRALEATARVFERDCTTEHQRNDERPCLDTVRIQGEPEHPDGGSAARL